MFSSKRLLFLCLVAAICTTVQARPEYDETSSYEDYDYLDYEESEEQQREQEEEPQPLLMPQFTTEAKSYKIEPGHTLRLPCRVDKLGPMVLSWKRKEGISYKYLSTGTHNMANDPRIAVEMNDDDENSSTLVVTLATLQDVGQYVCEVSSNPPATLRHEVSIIVPPTVRILRPSLHAGDNGWTDHHQSEEIKLSTGDELALVCKGTGDPHPNIKWTRERKRMPDGRIFVEGTEIIYKNVTRKHSGHYICQGSNGPGNAAKDSIKINVLHTPEIITEESYIQKDNGRVQLELVCIVHASPKALVEWYKDGQRLTGGNGGGSSSSNQQQLLPERVTIGQSGRKHLMVISGVTEADRGRYTCRAVNTIGESKGNIQVMGSEASTNHHEPRVSGSSPLGPVTALLISLVVFKVGLN